MGAISLIQLSFAKIKNYRRKLMWKTYKKSSLIVYNASKESVISILGNTLIQICVFDRKKNPSNFDRK